MREVKFRAWDEDNKRMWYSHEYGESVKVSEYGDEEGFFFIFEEKGLKVVMVSQDPNNQFNAQERGLPPMFYTGRKDDNNVELYEGDIYLDEFTRNGIDFKVKRVIKSIPDFYCQEVADQCFGDKMTKLGNIYENPELLKEVE